MIDVYANVKELCQRKRISITALEGKAGLGNGTIHSWRESSPKVSTLEAVADALGVKLTRLLREKNE